ncbi:hypothetical protein E2562_007076 [Oryza meyeriana var. granulata]|uniref:Uncharacterized protein n=1 Tax=Oryza meyeriana var. granulata TaxID=110450 RepID=A0A6G1F4T7_9ORYZ|nr:hypothetical protein E2562_007076 [Oryza meyeriana var. granulata]
MEAEQDGGGAEHAGETGGADGRPRGRRANDGDVLERTYGGHGGGDLGGKVPALSVEGVDGEVEHVAVARVVDHEEEPRRQGPSPWAPDTILNTLTKLADARDDLAYFNEEL